MEAIKELQCFCERFDSKCIIDKWRFKFLHCVPKTISTVLQSCFVLYAHSPEFFQLCSEYNIDVYLSSVWYICTAVSLTVLSIVFDPIC